MKKHGKNGPPESEGKYIAFTEEEKEASARHIRATLGKEGKMEQLVDRARFEAAQRKGEVLIK